MYIRQVFSNPDISYSISGLFKHSQAMSKLVIGDITLPGSRAASFGMFNSVSSIGFIVGPTVGGTIAMWDGGFQKVATLASMIFMLNAGLMWWFIPNVDVKLKQDNVSSARKKEKVEQAWSFSRMFFADFGRINWLRFWDVFLIGFIFSLSMLVFRSNLTSVLTYRYGTNSQTNGYILSFNGVVGAISSACLRFITPMFSSNKQMHNFFAIVLTASLILITSAPGIIWVCFGLVPLCVASAVLRVTHATTLHERSESLSRGLTSGVDATLTSLARACGPAIAGVAQELSILGPGLSGASLAAAATALGFIVMPRRKLDAHED